MVYRCDACDVSGIGYYGHYNPKIGNTFWRHISYQKGVGEQISFNLEDDDDRKPDVKQYHASNPSFSYNVRHRAIDIKNSLEDIMKSLSSPTHTHIDNPIFRYRREIKKTYIEDFIEFYDGENRWYELSSGILWNESSSSWGYNDLLPIIDGLRIRLAFWFPNLYDIHRDYYTLLKVESDDYIFIHKDKIVTKYSWYSSGDLVLSGKLTSIYPPLSSNLSALYRVGLLSQKKYIKMIEAYEYGQKFSQYQPVVYKGDMLHFVEEMSELLKEYII